MDQFAWSIILVAMVGTPSWPMTGAAVPRQAGGPAQAATVRPGPAKNYVRLPPPTGFTIDYPKDWQVLVGVGSSLAVVYSKARDAGVTVERAKLAVPLLPSEIIDATADQEKQEWQKRQPHATIMTHQFQNFGNSKTIIIDFSQPGAQGTEHVRIYNVIQGTDKYRVICTTKQPLFDKYKDTFQQIAFSLTPNPTQ
jgi:hypothetical protein